MIIESLLARVDTLEREASALRDRLDALENRGPITVQPAKPTVSAPVTPTVKTPTVVPTSTAKPTTK